MAKSRIFPISVGMVLLAALASAACASQFAQAEPAMAPTPPATLVAQVCQGCHGPEVMSQKGRSKDDWATVVQTMVERGAMASNQDLQTIVDYLAATYQTDKGAGR